MPDGEFLIALIKDRSTKHGIDRQTLWEAAFWAIAAGEFDVWFPTDTALAFPQTARGAILGANQYVQRGNSPEAFSWVRILLVKATEFDQLLRERFAPANQRRRRLPGAKTTKRDQVADFVAATYPGGQVPSDVPYKAVAARFTAETGITVTERTVMRALGGK